MSSSLPKSICQGRHDTLLCAHVQAHLIQRCNPKLGGVVLRGPKYPWYVCLCLCTLLQKLLTLCEAVGVWAWFLEEVDAPAK
mgnify:CR=1 FL=1